MKYKYFAGALLKSEIKRLWLREVLIYSVVMTFSKFIYFR